VAWASLEELRLDYEDHPTAHPEARRLPEAQELPTRPALPRCDGVVLWLRARPRHGVGFTGRAFLGFQPEGEDCGTHPPRGVGKRLKWETKTARCLREATGGVRVGLRSVPLRVRRRGRAARSLAGETLREVVGNGVRAGDVQLGGCLRRGIEREGRLIGFVAHGGGGVFQAFLQGRGGLEERQEREGQVVVLAELRDVEVGRDQPGVGFRVGEGLGHERLVAGTEALQAALLELGEVHQEREQGLDVIELGEDGRLVGVGQHAADVGVGHKVPFVWVDCFSTWRGGNGRRVFAGTKARRGSVSTQGKVVRGALTQPRRNTNRHEGTGVGRGFIGVHSCAFVVKQVLQRSVPVLAALARENDETTGERPASKAA
jgi:hypothetical protein